MVTALLTISIRLKMTRVRAGHFVAWMLWLRSLSSELVHQFLPFGLVFVFRQDSVVLQVFQFFQSLCG